MSNNVNINKELLRGKVYALRNAKNVFDEIKEPTLKEYLLSKIEKIEYGSQEYFDRLPKVNFPEGYESRKNFPCLHWLGEKKWNNYGIISDKLGGGAAHRLIYCVFNNNGNVLSRDLVVAHLCDNNTCCQPEHLIAASQKENQRHRFVHKNGKFMKNVKSNLTDQDVIDIRTMYASGDYTQIELAEQYGISRKGISNITTGFSHRNVGGPLTVNYSRKANNKIYANKRLTNKQVLEIRDMYNKDISLSTIARAFNMSVSNIYQIATGVYYSDVK